MIAEQLVPLLANLDPRLLMQMLQNLTNPSVATALSTYTAAVQFPVQNAADTGPQASASVVTTSSGNESVAAVQSADVVDSGRTVSAASSQSSIYTSEASEPDNDSTSVQTDTAQSCSQRYDSADEHPSPFDPNRPSSIASTSSSMYSTDTYPSAQVRPSPSDTIFYTCHLCAFRSSHKKHYVEHLSSEFSTTSIASSHRSSGEPPRRKRCSYCSFSTYISHEFDEHVRIHTSHNLYHCDHCSYVGPSINALKLHFRRSHKNKSVMFQDSMFGPKVNKDRCSIPQPLSVHLDPVVELSDLKSLDHNDLRKLTSRNGISCNICGL